MRKILIKTFSFLFIFSLFIWNTFALNAELKIDKNSSNINDYINLILEIESEKSWEIKVKNIKNLEKFDIISQSQSQSSRTNMVIVNWKTKSENISKVNLKLILKAKENWEYELWPAILENWSWTIESNSVKIKIDWNNLNILQNNNSNKVISKTNNKNNQKIEKNIEDKKISAPTDSIDFKEYNKNYELYILILTLLISSVIFYFLLDKNIKNKNMKKSSLWEDKKIWEIKENKSIKITYPKTEQDDFIEEITTIFKKKIWSKYSLEKIENLTLKEIMEKIPKNSKLDEISDLLNKAKYSGNTLDNKKILKFIKNI